MLKNSSVSCLVLIIAGIFIASNLYTMLPIQNILAHQFTISIEQASLASFCFIFCYAVGLLYFGSLADRFGERPVILTGMLVLSILTFTISFVDSFKLFLGARSIQGFLAASFAPAAFSYIFRYFQGKIQTVSIALINTGFLFAGVFGQILSAYFVYSFSLQTLFYAFSTFYFISFALLFLTLMKDKTNHSTKKSLTTIVTLIRHPSLKKLYITAFFLLFTVMAFYGSLELFLLKDTLNFPISLQTFRLISLIGIIPAFFANALVEKFQAKSVLISSLLMMTVGFLLSLISLNEWTILFASIFMIASTSLTIPMVILLIGKHAPSTKRARAISVYSFTLLIGASVGSLFAALLPFYFVLVGVAILFIALAILIRFVHEKTT
ncbi:MFS transporter [Salirhabdus sp. Marseille-P4669]|uniref:MFS transporter n=1 Tax=Salirhabdus sp. Marseille-P4669 TaxID=2042310 RepID=UPI000C7E60ED|nr:MFS transporter [Salirhabdus sp. Marseille-P4669]